MRFFTRDEFKHQELQLGHQRPGRQRTTRRGCAGLTIATGLLLIAGSVVAQPGAALPQVKDTVEVGAAVVVDASQLRAVASDAPVPRAPPRSEKYVISGKVVAVTPGWVMINVGSRSRQECMPSLQDLTLDVWVPRSALLPRQARQVWQEFEDQSAILVEQGAVLRPSSRGWTWQGVALTASHAAPVNAIVPRKTPANPSMTSTDMILPRHWQSHHCTDKLCMDSCQQAWHTTRSSAPTAHTTATRSPQTPAAAKSLMCNPHDVLCQVAQSLTVETPAPPNDLSNATIYGLDAHHCAAFCGTCDVAKTTLTVAGADWQLPNPDRSELPQVHTDRRKYWATFPMACGAVRAKLSQAPTPSRRALTGLGTLGSGKQYALAGSLLYWPDGQPAGRIINSVRFENPTVDESGKRTCFTLEGSSLTVCVDPQPADARSPQQRQRRH